MDTIDNRNHDGEQSRHPLFALEDALIQLRNYIGASNGKTIDDDLSLKLSIYLDHVEETYLVLKADVIERLVTDHNFRSPSLN